MTLIINFVDTNVLLELLDVPGFSANAAAYKAEFKDRYAQGEKFVIPVATIIEAGNHISQSGGDRHAAAKRFHDLLRSAIDGVDPFVVREASWDSAFLRCLLSGASTGQDFVQLAGAGRFGAGDISILVERDLFVETSNYDPSQVRIWTGDAELQAFA